MVSGPEPQCVARRAFEGLFQAALSDEPGLRSALREAGYSGESDRDFYPSRIWQNAIDIARTHRFGELPPEEGMRQLGRLFVDGFAQTTVGRVLASAAPWMGPERLLARLPSYIKTVCTDVSVAIAPLGLSCWRLTFEDPQPSGYFVMGVLEQMLALCSVKADPKLVEQTEGQYVIDVQWE
jgi:uncharacterized protein (TIGR02265 family)